MRRMDEPYQTLANDALRDVGSLILVFGQLETQLTWSMTEMQPGLAGPHVSESGANRMLIAIFNKWFAVYGETTAAGIERAKRLRERVLSAGQVRNIIAHGFDGLWLDPGDYALVCFERYHQNRMTGNFPPQRFYPATELRALIAEVQTMRREITDLTSLALSRPRKPKGHKVTK